MQTSTEGLIYEYKAAQLLKEKGYEIIAQNVNFAKIGELDIVALYGLTLVIVEVKYRTNADFGHPLESLTKPKLQKILKATNRYLSECKHKYSAVRFDVICFLGDVAEHIENAFYGHWM